MIFSYLYPLVMRKFLVNGEYLLRLPYMGIFQNGGYSFFAVQLDTENGGYSFIPEGEFDVNLHGVHLEPCYKKFTGIIAKSKKRKAVEEILPVNRPRRSKNDTTYSTSGIFPKHCIFCKKWRITIKRKIFTPHINHS